MASRRLERAMTLSVWEGGLATVMGTLTGGVFLTGFALALGASRFQIGMMAALPAIANFAQILGAFLIERTGRRKSICLTATLGSRLLWLGIILLPLFQSQLSPFLLVWIAIGILAVSHLLAAINGVSWMSWTKDLVPAPRLVEFFGRRNVANTALSIVMSLVSIALVRILGGAQSTPLHAFMAIFAVAMVCGLAGVPLLAAIPDPGMAHIRKRPFLSQLTSPLRDRNFRRIVLFYAFWNLAVQMALPFFAVYMLENLAMPFWYVTLLCTSACLCGLLANRFWTRMIQKFGTKPIVILATVGEAAVLLLWLLIAPGTTWLLPLVHVASFFNAPLALGPNNLVLKFAPTANASAYLAVYQSVVGPMTAIGGILGGLVASELAGTHWSVGPLSFCGLQLLFLLSSAGRLLSLPLLRPVVEPEARSVRNVWRVLQRARPVRRQVAWAYAMIAPAKEGAAASEGEPIVSATGNL